jgi:hypothetical protein
MNIYNLDNMRHEISRRNTSKTGVIEFKMGYQPTINLEKDKNGVLLADSPSNLNR